MSVATIAQAAMREIREAAVESIEDRIASAPSIEDATTEQVDAFIASMESIYA